MRRINSGVVIPPKLLWGEPKIISPPRPRISEYGGRHKSPRVFPRGGSQKKVPIVLYLRRPIKISIFCMLFVPIFNVVSTAPGDILDTIECFSHGFSVVRMSLAAPNRNFYVFYTNAPSKWVKNICIYACGGKKYGAFSFLLVYRTHPGKHKTLNVGPPQARKITL